MDVYFKISPMHNVLVCLVSKSVLHFSCSDWYDTIRMTVAAKKTQKPRNMEKDSVTTKASFPYQHELRTQLATPKYTLMMVL